MTDLDLDFDDGIDPYADVPLGLRPRPDVIGTPVGDRPAQGEYPSWVCDCAKPVRHYWTGEKVIIAGRGPDDPSVDCPTWRPTVKTWRRPVRVWRNIAPAAPVAPAVPVVTYRCGPVEGPRALGADDIPPRCTARGIVARSAPTTALIATGRRVDDGPVVTMIKLAGVAPDGTVWTAWWTDGRFEVARLHGRPANLTELRAVLACRA